MVYLSKSNIIQYNSRENYKIDFNFIENQFQMLLMETDSHQVTTVGRK